MKLPQVDSLTVFVSSCAMGEEIKIEDAFTERG
jgi:hypothetical protein